MGNKKEQPRRINEFMSNYEEELHNTREVVSSLRKRSAPARQKPESDLVAKYHHRDK